MEKFSEKVTKQISVNSNDAWEVISMVKGVDQWFSTIIKTCKVDGDKRYCETQDGSELKEDILLVDHDNMIFVYGIPKQEMLPVEDIIGTMKVYKIDNETTEIEWSGTFLATEKNASIAKEAFRGLWSMGIDGIESYINANK